MSRSDEEYSPKDCWPLIESYFDKKHLTQLVKHQIESYNEFIQNQMKKTIDMFKLDIKSSQDYIKEFKKYRLEISITFENLCFLMMREKEILLTHLILL